MDMVQIVFRVSNIILLLFALWYAVGFYILPIQRMKRNAPGEPLLFSSKKQYIATLILSALICAIGIMLIVLQFFDTDSKPHSFSSATWLLWFPLMYNGVVVRTKDELFLCGACMKISDIEKISLKDTGIGLYATVKRKNGRTLNAYTSREAKRFLNDLIAGLSSEKEYRMESL